MDNLTINWRENLIKLFPETTVRTKGEHDEWCPKCSGLGLFKDGNCVVGCSVCNGSGVIKACECGNKVERYHASCRECRTKKFKEQEAQKEKERFESAKKILFDDYEGLFLWNESAITKEDLEDELCSLMYNGEEPPIYIWGTIKHKVFTDIDLVEIVANKCEDGYEDMETYFDYKDEDFLKAQELVNKWLVKHEGILDVYYEDFKTAVLLEKVIEDIRKQNKE